MSTVAAIVRSTALEAVRTRLAWVFAVVAVGGVGAAGFIGALALTETRQLQAALLAGALRLALVVLVAAFACASVVREADDRVRDLVLALPQPRHHYVLGKLAGLCAVGSVGAVIVTLPLLPFAQWDQCLLWCVTLACEVCIVAAFALFCAGGLAQATASLAATLAFYILARAIGSITLLAARGAPAGDPATSPGAAPLATGVGGVADLAVKALAFLLPRLDGFARTEWLVYATGTATDGLLCAGQTIIYVALLAAAATFDLQRKEIE